MKRVDSALLVVFALAFFVRLVCLIQVSESPILSVLVGDASGYDTWARHIAAGHWLGERVFYQAPLYPYFLATIYSVVGHDLFAARMVQIVLGSVGCLFLAWAGRILFRRSTGLIAGVLLALYPPAIFFDLIIQKGSLGLFFTTLLLLLVARASIRPNRGVLIAIGLALGLFALIRENALLLAVVVLVWLMIEPRGEPYSVRRTRPKWFLLGLIAVLVTVGARNYKVGGQFLITTSQFGPNLYIGNNPNARGLYESLRPGRGDPRFERLDATELAEADTGRKLLPAEVSDYWSDRALDYIRSDPFGWSRLMLRKWMLVWNAAEFADAEDIESYADASSVLRTLGHVAHFGTLLPLAAFGICATWNLRRRLWWLYVMVMAMAASIAMFYVFARYRLSLVPICALFAAAALVRGRSMIEKRQTTGLLIATACAAIAAFASNWTLVPGYEPRMATYTNIGAVLAENGRYPEAVDFYNRALAINPDLPETRANLGAALSALGRDEEALPHLTEALRLSPDPYPAAQRDIGIALAKLKRYDEALTHVTEFVRLTPTANAHYLLATTLDKLGRFEVAHRHYEESLQLQPDFAAAPFAQARLYERQGNLERAEQAYRRALEIAHNFINAHESLARLLINQDRIGEAEMHMERAIKIAETANQIERAESLRRQLEQIAEVVETNDAATRGTESRH